MKITIKEKLPTSVSLGKKPSEFIDVQKTIDLPDDLTDMTVAVIDELFDRANQFRKIDKKEIDYSIGSKEKFYSIFFPLLPSAFYQVDLVHENGETVIIKNVKWNNYWSNFPQKDIPVKRTKVLEKLNELGVVFGEIDENIKFSEHIENTELIIDAENDKLISLREEIIDYQKSQQEVSSNDEAPISSSKPLIESTSETKWSDVTIKWINGNDVEISLKNNPSFKKVMDYKELGFYDYKRKGPNLLWKILKNAALYDSTMSWGNLGGVSDSEIHKNIDNFQKQVSLLRAALRLAFGTLKGTKHEPFVPYSHDKEYKITVNLIPQDGSKNEKKEDWKSLLSEKELYDYEQKAKEEFIQQQSKLASTREEDY